MSPFVQKILAVLAAAIAGGFKPPNSLANDVADLKQAADAIEQIDPNVIPAAELGKIEGTAAGLVNLASGQAAVVGEVGASFDGHADKVAFFAIRLYEDPAVPAPADSAAAQIKAILGL